MISRNRRLASIRSRSANDAVLCMSNLFRFATLAPRLWTWGELYTILKTVKRNLFATKRILAYSQHRERRTVRVTYRVGQAYWHGSFQRNENPGADEFS